MRMLEVTTKDGPLWLNSHYILSIKDHSNSSRTACFITFASGSGGSGVHCFDSFETLQERLANLNV